MVDGLVRIKPLIKLLHQWRMPAVAITDHMNLFGVVKFYQAAIATGIKPIIGVHCVLGNALASPSPWQMIALCQNQQGYRYLTELISRAYRENYTALGPQIVMDWLQHPDPGLIWIADGLRSDVGCALLENDTLAAQTLARQWKASLGDRYYLGISRIGKAGEMRFNKHLIKFAADNDIPLVATNEVRYLTADEFEAHEARICVHGGYLLEDSNRPRPYTMQQYCRTEQEMQILFRDCPQALRNSVEIAKRCSVILELDQTHLPNFPIPGALTASEYLNQQAEQGLEKYLQKKLPKHAPQEHPEIRTRYQQRLKIECEVINRMGYPGYFLIVADFIAWAKQQNVPVGPGRGSGAGSLVAYALGITDLDPLMYDLLFERFLNPERVSMPDFDIDFCMEGRDRVIEYVASRYGRESVGQIITFGTMAARAVVRDVGRVLGHPYGFVDQLAKLIPFELGITLDKALIQDNRLRDRYEQEPEVKTLIDLAKQLEGITRNAGKHAGGVVIAPTKLTDFVPLYCEQGSASIVTQFDKDDVEAIGLVKFDFLGLRTLTIIHWAVLAINRLRLQTQQSLLKIEEIPLDDPETYQLLKACNTTAVFQLESRGMKDLIRRLQPDRFEEIIALVALFRPGPLQSGMVDDFINRKHGHSAIEYPHPALESILQPTYGVILYQEQVMQIAQILAGYSLGSADLLRRAMGKKKVEEMAKHRELFTQGAAEHQVAPATATYIFDLMEKFADYGFNKSHSAAYALLAYQTAWLKCHYPAEFMSAVLSSDMDNTDKLMDFLEDCRQNKLTLLAPSINESQYAFTVVDAATLRYGLGAVKGVGHSAIDAIVQAREATGPFKDLYDFCLRVDSRKLNKRVFEALIKSGAMDCFDQHRAALLATLPRALKVTEMQAKQHVSGQLDLFADDNNFAIPCEYAQIKAWQQQHLLDAEKESLGFYFSGHPIDAYLHELIQIRHSRISEINPYKAGNVIIAGIIVALRVIMTKRNEPMAFLTLDDRSSRLEIIVFSDLFKQVRDQLHQDAVVIVSGEVEHDSFSGGNKMIAQSLTEINQYRLSSAKAILISLHESQLAGESMIEHIQRALRVGVTRDARCPVWIEYEQKQGKARVTLGDNWRVLPTDHTLMQLRAVVGEQQVSICY